MVVWTIEFILLHHLEPLLLSLAQLRLNTLSLLAGAGAAHLVVVVVPVATGLLFLGKVLEEGLPQKQPYLLEWAVTLSQ
jgi:hypothetical protein